MFLAQLVERFLLHASGSYWRSPKLMRLRQGHNQEQGKV